MIEYFMYIGPKDPPKDFVAVTGEVPDSASRISISDAGHTISA